MDTFPQPSNALILELIARNETPGARVVDPERGFQARSVVNAELAALRALKEELYER